MSSQRLEGLGRGEGKQRAVVAAHQFLAGAERSNVEQDDSQTPLRIADQFQRPGHRQQDQHGERDQAEQDVVDHYKALYGLDRPLYEQYFRYFGGIADKVEGVVVPVDAGFLNYVLREPLGVVGQIVPWNFPLMFTSWKMGPALAAGNTVVMKPAEITPLSALRIAKLMSAVGFPKGVVNIIPGFGHTAGQALAEHMDVNKIAFTGSTAVGRKIVQASASNLKRVQLELGGKGATVVFADAAFDEAVQIAALAAFRNQGQVCTAGSRILQGYRSPFDATVVTKLAQAGVVTLGKLNCDEFAMGGANENSAIARDSTCTSAAARLRPFAPVGGTIWAASTK